MATESESPTLPAPRSAAASNLTEIPEAILVKRYNLTRAELNAIKTALAPPGTTDYELMLYVGVCRRLGLDPFVPGLVHFARFRRRDGSGERTAIIIGIYGYLEIAQQQKDCDGLVVKSYPEDFEKPPTYATCTVYRKTWSHPLEVSVPFKEANQPKSDAWTQYPRRMLENAAIRRAAKLAWPTLFGAIEDEDQELAPYEPEAVRQKLGTTLGEHHDTPAPVEAEAKVVPASVEETKREIRELLDASTGSKEGAKAYTLLCEALDRVPLQSLVQAGPEHLSLLEATLVDIRQVLGK
jgi:phage recombination protein Bet